MEKIAALPLKTSREIKEIIIHCSATTEGKNFTVEDINRWHKERGFNEIGYHYVIYLDGSIHLGRSLDKAGAHCTGHNSKSIGICYIGGVAKDGKTAKDTRTLEQKKSLLGLLKELKAIYPNAKIHGHNEFSNKDCPSFNVNVEFKDI